MGFIHTIRYSFSRALCLLLAIHFFNLSVDSTDPHPDSVSEDLAINDIESVIEFVAEIVFGLDNIFAEHDEPDHHGRSTQYFKLFLLNGGLLQKSSSLNLLCAYPFFLKNTSHLDAYILDISSPPPRA